ncbi:MAG: hypothetical protein K0S02_3919 [Achromobacter mucicolens]|jgi:hypothetical protein|uniref:hypothetical protein n=1 Tax=Achromobacter mucicolens TaxID=1389922 RepID=UPI00242F0CB1|nr:hypothetical protein [Achromobacter mucicolens]MDF2863647.1 hypothetical protein [Achromobacter mucicolens]
MAKLIKAFRGVPKGAIYPVEFAAGEECPPELEAGARDLGALEASADDSDEKKDLMAQLDAAQIKYDKRWGLDKLRAALAEGQKD